MAAKARVPCHAAQIASASASDSAVDKSPVVTLSRAAAASPGQSRRSRHGHRPGMDRPGAASSPGSQPNAGASVPASPAATGPISSASVTSGAQGSSRGRRARGAGAAASAAPSIIAARLSAPGSQRPAP